VTAHRRSSRIIVAAALALLLASLPLASAHKSSGRAPATYENGESNSFGTIGMTPYADGRDGPAAVTARVRLDDAASLAQAAHLMFAFNLHSSTAHVRFDSLETPDGKPLPVLRDERDRRLQPRVMVDPALVPPGEYVVHGTAWSNGTGRFHVGVLVIAFAADWSTLRTAGGDRAELYAFAMLDAEGPVGTASFEGQGNPAWAWLLPVAGLVVAAVGGSVLVEDWRAQRRRQAAAEPEAGATGTPSNR
jgi:hypothetical protein